MTNDELFLIEQAKIGDEKAFTTILNKHKMGVFNVAYKIVGNETVAEDLTIEVFSTAFSNILSYSPDYAFTTWLYKITTNHCIDYIRRKQTLPKQLDIESSETHSLIMNTLSDDRNPEEIVIDEQHISIIKNKVSQLKQDYRKIIELRYFREYSYEEIAKELNIPIGTVKAKLHRAKKSLYNLIKK